MPHLSPSTPDVPPAPRRSRWRRRLWRGGCALGLTLFAAVLAAVWLLGSGGGRDLVLRQLAARLPEGASLTWNQADGVLLDSVSLRDVRYAQASPTLTVTVERLRLDLSLWLLLAKRVQFNTLAIGGALLDLPGAEPEPFAWPRWPEVLPDIPLPVTIAADALAVEHLRIQRQGAPLLDIHSAHGRLAIGPGFVRAGNLKIDSDRGRFTLDGHYAAHTPDGIDLTASALLPAAPGQPRPRFGLVARGTLDALDVALSGYAPDRLRVQWSLRGEAAPQWNMTAHADALDLGLLTGGTPGTSVAFALHADGAGDTSHWRGEVRQGTLSAVLHPSTLHTRGQRLELESALVELGSSDLFGALHASGHLDLSQPDAPHFMLNLATDKLTLAGDSAAGAVPLHLRSQLELSGRTDAWSLRGDATLTRTAQQAAIALHAHGDAQRLRIDSLHATMPGGSLNVSGSLTWQPSLGWDAHAVLAGFDPDWFIPGWPGALTAHISSRASTDPAGTLRMQVDAHDLGGQLRERALAGNILFTRTVPASTAAQMQMQGEANLRLGASRIEAKGEWGEQMEIEATLSPLHLADLIPAADGQLRGRLQVSGTPRAPTLTANLSGHHLSYAGMQAAALEFDGMLPARAGSEGTLTLHLSGINTGTITMEQIQIKATGASEDMRLHVHVAGELGTLTADLNAQQHSRTWHGSLSALQLVPAGATPWHLQQPLEYAQNRSGWTLQRGCLAASGDGMLCGEIDWPRRISVNARAVPLALAAPLTARWLPEPAPGHPWRLRGMVDLTADLSPRGATWQGNIDLTSSDGGLRASDRASRDVISYHDLTLEIALTPEQIRAHMDAGLDADGHARIALTTGWDETAPLEGSLALDVRDLSWLELLSQDLAASQGRLSGSIGLAGTRTQPSLRGQAQLGGFSAELPALAITLEQGEINLSAEPDGSARLDGSVRSGEGTLHLDGSLNWRDSDAPLRLNLHGTQVLASDTRDLRLIINPELSVRYAAGQPLSVNGSVGIASGMLDLERLDSGVSASADVVVVDSATLAHTRGALPLRLDITLNMGQDVRLRGFGLNGKLDGRLRVRAEPEHEMVGTGQLEVSGNYKAYGQTLTITRGTLVFSKPTSPLAARCPA